MENKVSITLAAAAITNITTALATIEKNPSLIVASINLKSLSECPSFGVASGYVAPSRPPADCKTSNKPQSIFLFRKNLPSACEEK